MAIKGKKKPQSRRGQSRRRPATAPRTIVVPGRRIPWYRTPTGKWVAGILGAIAAVIVLVLVLNARSDAKARDELVSQLDDYTGRVRALVQTLTPPVSGMIQAPTAPPEDLAETSAEWVKELRAAVTESAGLAPPPEEASSSILIGHTLSLYQAAAETYKLVANADEKLQGKILERASAQAQTADLFFQTAVSLIDQNRAELDLNPSGIRAPGAAPPTGAPQPGASSLEIPIESSPGG